jgi:nanoRNase/pAp phosphatase (c-di-AMP/oligoRNAs hydrolase)
MENQNPKQQAIDKLKQASNVLVTVSANPSVDQLASAIGFALLLNKLGKHATAVFSGNVPSTIEFLQPEKTLEKTTDSLRDFIIALDKSKADKLRYKVEDQHVKIFITPYKTTITEGDLEFSQGDFNIDAVVAIGVQKKDELDQAITAHGRILHDATVITVNNTGNAELGVINWTDAGASSLCEMLVSLGTEIKADVLDEQIATALLTGIVAETQRFSNEKTSSTTMSLSAQLMAAGANQQLVATRLEQSLANAGEKPVEETKFDDRKMDELANEPAPANNEQVVNEPITEPEEQSETTQEEPQAIEQPNADGAIEIDHGEAQVKSLDDVLAMGEEESDEQKLEQIHIDEHGTLRSQEELEQHKQQAPSEDNTEGEHPRLVLQPPTLGAKPVENPITNDTPLDSDTAQAPSDAPELPSVDSAMSATSTGDDMALPAVADQSLTPAEAAHPFDGIVAPPQQPATIPDSPLPSLDAANEAASLPPLPSAETSLPDFSAPPQPFVDPTLTDLEKTVDSPHLQATDFSTEPAAHVDAARDAVAQAMANIPPAPQPLAGVAAQPMDLNLGPDPASSANSMSQFGPPQQLDLPSNLVPNTPPTDTTASQVTDPTAPPPVPPPMMPPAFGAPDQQPPQNNNPSL